MTTASYFSLLAMRRLRLPVAWLFVLLVLTVFVEHRVAVFDGDDSAERLLQNDEAVEGEEILNKLILANDVAVPLVVHVAPLQRERPALLTVTTRSLLAVRGLESRAPPAVSFSA
jgi:hypothetical protein